MSKLDAARLIRMFEEEAASQLAEFTRQVAVLSNVPTDADALRTAHRMVHSIKGSAAMVRIRVDDTETVRRLTLISDFAGLAEVRLAKASDKNLPLLRDEVFSLRSAADCIGGLLGASSDELAGYDNRLALLDAALRFDIVRNSETLHARLLAETESADDSVLSADPVDGALAKLEVEAGIEAVASSRPEHPPPKKASRSPKPKAQPVEVDPVPSFEEPPRPARVRAAPISDDEGAAVISTLAALFGLGDSGEPDLEPPQEALDGPTVVEPSAAFQSTGTELDDLLDLAQETEEQDTLRSITVPTNGADAVETQPEEEPATAAEPPLVDDSLRDVFIEEAALLFDGLSADLVQLEQTPNDPEPLARALRAVHTLKGSSATVGYGKIRALTTLMEDVLRKAGEKDEAINPDAVAVLLAASEGVETLMREIAGSGRELTANASILDQLQTVLGQLEPTPDGSVNPADQSQPRVIAEAGGSEASFESDSLRAIFVKEAQGILEVLSRDLVALENGSTAMDTVHRALRGAHSLKGSAAMLGFAGMRTLSHAMEDGLQVIRDGQISASSKTIDLMLDAVDALEIAVEAVEQNGKEPRNQKLEQLAERLRQDAARISGVEIPAAAVQPTKEEAASNDAFLSRLHEWQTDLTQSLIALEMTPSDVAARARFAAVSAACATAAQDRGHKQIYQLSNLMDAIAQAPGASQTPVSEQFLDALGDALEQFTALCGAVQNAQSDQTLDISNLVTRLEDIRDQGRSSPAPKNVVAQRTPVEAPKSLDDAAADKRRGSRRIVEVDLDRLNQLMNLAAELVISRTRLSSELGKLETIGSRLEEQGTMLSSLERRLTSISVSRQAATQQDDGLLKQFTDSEFDRFSELDIIARDLRDGAASVLDSSGDFAGLASNFDHNVTRISVIAKDLHDEVLRVRMIEVERAYTRLPRIIRDAARAEGIEVNLVLEGAETEIDKNILEALNTPLMHILRNCVAHGLESPTERVAVGKPPTGTVTVRASQNGNQVVIEVTDDGRGIDPAKIRKAAVERGFLTAEQVSALTDAEIVDVIFEPGFSTSKEVTEISGRGVGMDVVRSVVTRFNGTVGVETKSGRGTTFRLALPLTLAIGQALLVKVAGAYFALQLGMVGQIEDVYPDEIVTLKDQPFIYRENVPVPLVVLANSLGMGNAVSLGGQNHPVVVVRDGDRQTGLLVDQIVGRDDIVIKTLGHHLRHIPGIIGATILGDGSVALILNASYFLSALNAVSRRTGPTSSHSAPAQFRPPRQPPEPHAMTGRNTPTSPRETIIATPEVGSKPQLSQGKRPRILVVDDSVSIRKHVSGVLERGGYDATTANDGLDAWEKIQKQPFDVVISDLEMPRMHGYELIAEIRRNEQTRLLPVVFLTARAGEKHRRAGLELGASAFLNKPFSEQELLALLTQLTA